MIKHYGIKDAKDIHEVLKDMFSETIQEMLEAELDEHLGYSKYDYKNKDTTNSRNGKRSKKILSDLGSLKSRCQETGTAILNL